MSLKGRRAFITGSFQGIGLGIATAMAREGASIVLHGLADAETVAKLVANGKGLQWLFPRRDPNF